MVETRLLALLADPEGRPMMMREPTLQDVEPGRRQPDDGLLLNDNAPRQDLSEQSWGWIVSKGHRAQYEVWLEELLAFREEELGYRPRCFELESRDTDPRGWHAVHTTSPDKRKALPLYLAIVGDFDEISVEFQQGLDDMLVPYVGRIAFSTADGRPDEAGYRSYARKVVAYNNNRDPQAAREKASVLFFSSNDGTEAVKIGTETIIEPGWEQCRQGPLFKEAFDSVLCLNEAGITAPEALLDHAEVAGPNVLLTLSHGMGPPKEGWVGQARRLYQGAMSFGGGHYLKAADLKEGPFLPGGIWFFIACFSAGTPDESAFAHWLDALPLADIEYERESVLSGLKPGQGEKGPSSSFVAALPQAALANPQGPVAVIGHVDLAWTYGMATDLKGPMSAMERFLERHRRFTNVLLDTGTDRYGVWTNGPKRVGSAFQRLSDGVRSLDARLLEIRDLAKRGDFEHIDGALWMGRQDLRGYILLGDPAVHLALGRPKVR